MNPLYDRNERISKVLSANYDKIIKLVDVTKIEKNKNIEIKREVNVYSCCIDCGFESMDLLIVWTMCKALMFYCLKCRKNMESKNSRFANTKKKKKFKCLVCGGKKSRFIKEQKASGLLSRNTNTFKSNSASRPYFILKA